MANLGQAKSLFSVDLAEFSSRDSDGDGLSDIAEINIHHTDPYNADTDGDGLTDGYEVNFSRTNPNSSDSDGDGLSDAEEVALGTNPNLKDTDRDEVWDGVDQYPLDPRRVQDIPVVHYIAIDIGTPIIGDHSVFAIALDDSNQVAFGYNDETPGVTHVVRWEDGAQVGSRIDYPLSYNLGAVSGAEIWATSVDTTGTITGAGFDLDHPENGSPQGYVMSPSDSYPSFHTLFQQYPEFHFTDISSSYGRTKNGGATYGGETFAYSGCSDCYVLSISFINGSPTNPFYPELLNDSGAAVGRRGSETQNISHLSTYNGGAPEDIFPTTEDYDPSRALAIGTVSGGYCVLGLSPYLAGVTTLEEILVPPSETSHPFLKVESEAPIDFYSVLGIFKNQLAFPSDYNAGAGMNNEGDILIKARTIDGPTNTAPYSRQVLVLWDRATQSLHEIDLPDKIKLGDPYRTIGNLQLNSGHLIVAVQEFDDEFYLPNTRALLGVPVEMRITDRDDPTKKWTDNVVKGGVVYAGEFTGDMVSWKLRNTDNWTGVTFTWSAEGPETYSGPSGVGKNEWRIADGDADTQHDWIDWKPGTYTIKCMVTFPNGVSSTGEFEQEVGVRTDDVVVVGWIDPAQVPLNSSGVQSALVQVFPPGGLASASPEAKAKAAQLLNIIATQGVNFSPEIGPPDNRSYFTPFSATDKTYALNWMFKYAGNQPPPTGFTDGDGFFSQQKLDDFTTKENHTLYKLLNHCQAKYRVGDDQKFKPGTLVHLKHGVQIGYTTDPSRYYEVTGVIAWIGRWVNSYPAGGAFPGTAGPNNSRTPVTKDTESKLCNEGRPDQKALDAFRQLTGQDQGQIWSSITFFSDQQHYSETISSTTGQSLTRAPKPQYFYQGRINTQVYPTYWMYINGKKDAAVQNQAPSPSALFPNTDKCQ